jgi:hypothetical protein
MTEVRLKVRCLASTRVFEQAWHEQEFERKDEEATGENLNHAETRSLPLRNGQKKELDEAAEAQDVAEDRLPVTRSSPSLHSVSESESSDYESNESLKHHSDNRTSCVQEAQLSPDGTCIFTSDFNRSFSVYPIDINLQSGTNTRSLKPYARFTSPDPIWSFAANPLFDVNDPNSTHVLISRRDRYITLHNALWNISQTPSDPNNKSPVDIFNPITSYKLINPLTEAVTAPLSLTYSHSGTHFFAGHRNAIATFDLEHTDTPIHTIPTIPSARSKLKGGGRGFKGYISSLTLSPPSTFAPGGLLAAGSRTRHVGIYDATSAEEITTFTLPGTLDGKKIKSQNANMRHVMGDGISFLKYSPCGTYLYVAERQSDVLLIYDVRNFSLALGYCSGRNAMTNQKLGFDVWNAGASPYDIEAMSHEVWAGGVDGMVRVWRDPYRKEGAVEADEVVRVGEGDGPVVGAMVHASGSLAVAACGRVEVGDGGFGRKRGGDGKPKCREWGSLDILGLS